MDLSQSMMHLEGIRRGAPVQPMFDLQGANARVNPLSQMDYNMLQNGLLGRSHSALELGAVPQASSQFHLSDSAMLVGTVAALQEESGQLRSQWKCDVARLESELDQLRSAAAWALPHLTGTGAQNSCPEASLQGLVLPGQRGGLGPWQQSLMLQGAVTERSDRCFPMMKGLVLPERDCSSNAMPQTARTEASHFSEVSQLTCGGDREQLLGRMAELERQRSRAQRDQESMEIQRELERMEMQRDQALCGQMRSPPAPERSPAAVERLAAMEAMPMIPERNSNPQPHQHSAMQLTEALLCQMRASCVVENQDNLQVSRSNQDNLQMSRSSTVFAEEPPPIVSRNMDALAGSMLGPAAGIMRMPPEESPFSATFSGLAPAPARGLQQPAMAPARAPEEMEESRASALSEAAQIYQELEMMEIELRKVRDENGRLKEDKEACEAAHKRDVTTLEDMLGQMMEDNERLNKALADAGTMLSASEKKVTPVGGVDNTIVYSKKVEDPLTPHSIRSVSEPNIEPDTLSPNIERSINFDRLNHSMGYNIACGAR